MRGANFCFRTAVHVILIEGVASGILKEGFHLVYHVTSCSIIIHVYVALGNLMPLCQMGLPLFIR